MPNKLYTSKNDVYLKLDDFVSASTDIDKMGIYTDLKTIWTKFLEGQMGLEDIDHLWNSIVEMHVNLYQPV